MTDWRKWARACIRDKQSPSNLTRESLAMLTGQDSRALDGFVACMELYASADDTGARVALAAAQLLLNAMQPKCRWVARELIPCVLDWPDREKLWLALAEASLIDRPPLRLV